MRVIAIASLILGACATVPSVQSSPSAVAAYEAVRSGQKSAAAGGDVQFCAGPTATIAQRTKWRPSDDWNAQFRDSAVASNVRQTLHADPALAGSDIDVNVQRGAVHLEGQVPNATLATKAIARSLQVDGTVMVQARLFTPREPNPPPPGDNRFCS